MDVPAELITLSDHSVSCSSRMIDTATVTPVELASEVIAAFASRYQEHWLAGMREKLGLSSNEDSDLWRRRSAQIHRSR